MDELACFAPGMLALGSSGFGPDGSQKFLSLAEEVFLIAQNFWIICDWSRPFSPSKFNINFGLFIIFGRTIVREIVEEENRLCYALKLELKPVKSKLLTNELCQVHMNKL